LGAIRFACWHDAQFNSVPEGLLILGGDGPRPRRARWATPSGGTADGASWKGRGHRFNRRAPSRRMKAPVLHSLSPPIMSPIRPPAVAAPDDGGRAPELAAVIALREAPTVFLGCGPHRSDAAARTMGHVGRRGGRRCIVEGARPSAQAACRAWDITALAVQPNVLRQPRRIPCNSGNPARAAVSSICANSRRSASGMRSK